MKLSIITVNLNNAAGLEKTAESIVSQTFKDFEWIVIDGGSTDGSVDVIRKYSKNIAYWVSEQDSGIYNAMNKGTRIARGEYLQFLNSGDWLCDQNVIADVNKTPFESSIVYGNVYHMDGSRLVRETKYGELSFRFMLESSISHQSSFILKDLLIRFPYNENYKIVSDWEFWLKMILKGEKFQYIDRVVCCFDLNGISETNKSLNELERSQVVNEIVPSCIMHDYKAGKIGELIDLKRKYPLFGKFITFCTMAMDKFEKMDRRSKK